MLGKRAPSVSIDGRHKHYKRCGRRPTQQPLVVPFFNRLVFSASFRVFIITGISLSQSKKRTLSHAYTDLGKPFQRIAEMDKRSLSEVLTDRKEEVLCQPKTTRHSCVVSMRKSLIRGTWR